MPAANYMFYTKKARRPNEQFLFNHFYNFTLKNRVKSIQHYVKFIAKRCNTANFTLVVVRNAR